MTDLERNILGMLICDNDGIYDPLIDRVRTVVIEAAADRNPLEKAMLAWCEEARDAYGYEKLPWLAVVHEILYKACYHKLVNWNELATELVKHFKADIEYYERNVKEENWA